MRAVIVCLVLVGLAPVARAGADPAKAGKLRVGVATVQAVDKARGDRTLTTEIWYPARTAARDAEPLPRAYPLVLVAHGFNGSRTNYEFLTLQLASRGFVVAAPSFPGLTTDDDVTGTSTVDDLPLDLSFVCAALHDTGGPLAQYAVHVRGVPTGLVGHSLGGYAVVKATEVDPAFTTVVALAPAPGLDPADLVGLDPPRALMVMGGTADATVSLENSTQPFFDGLPAPAFLVRITGGTHSGFTDVDSHLTPEALAAQQTIVRRYATAFFTRYLARKRKYGRFLKTADAGAASVTARPK